MPARAVVQPNGLFARFSTIVDNFTHANYTEQELWEVFRDECGVDCANGKIQRAKAEPERFEDSISDIKMVHGPLEAERMTAFLSAKTEEELDTLPLPATFRTKNEAFDVDREIADLKRHLEAMPETGDEDEDYMRNRYVREIEKLEKFVAERNAATDEAHQRLMSEFFAKTHTP